MSEDTKTQFKTEGEPAFPVADKENDDSTSSSEGEKTNGDQTQSQDGDKSGEKSKKDDTENLADHPRWKEREEDWKKRFNEQEKRHTEDLQKFREEVEGKIGKGKPETDEAPTEIPSWFGGDENEWKSFKSWNDKQLAEVENRGAEKAQKAIEQRSEAEQKRIDEATTFMQDEVTVIEADKKLNPDGLKVDKNKLLKFVLDNELVDTKGRWNYRAGWQMMQAGVKNAKAESTDERKKIAGATTGDNHTETKPPAFMTSKDFQNPSNRPW